MCGAFWMSLPADRPNRSRDPTARASELTASPLSRGRTKSRGWGRPVRGGCPPRSPLTCHAACAPDPPAPRSRRLTGSGSGSPLRAQGRCPGTSGAETVNPDWPRVSWPVDSPSRAPWCWLLHAPGLREEEVCCASIGARTWLGARRWPQGRKGLVGQGVPPVLPACRAVGVGPHLEAGEGASGSGTLLEECGACPAGSPTKGPRGRRS